MPIDRYLDFPSRLQPPSTSSLVRCTSSNEMGFSLGSQRPQGLKPRAFLRKCGRTGGRVLTRNLKRALPRATYETPSSTYIGVTIISFFGILRRNSSPVKMCSFTKRDGVCASHSANEMS